MTEDTKNLLERLKIIKPEKEYKLTDLAYGRFFAKIFEDQARFNVTTKSWYIYNGKIWTDDESQFLTVHQYAKELYDALLLYALDLPDGALTANFVSWVSKYSHLSKRETLIRDARSEFFFTKEDLDSNIYKFNCLNGTLDLKSFEFCPHSPTDLLSKISNVIYDPDAKSPRWEKFIDEVLEGNADKIKYIQKILGYCLTGLTEAEQFFILYGSKTRNGKSSLVETFGHMLGGSNGYALTIQPETLAVKTNKDSRTHTTDIARLRGCRFVNAPEPPSRMHLDTALVKNWTGGDTISAREIFEKQTEFRPQFKLLMNTNWLPSITDRTLFSSRRVNIIEFNRHFLPHEQDSSLKATLREPDNISGIFNWCLEGLREYYRDGLNPPDCVVNANNRYYKNSDKVQLFIDDCLVKSGQNVKAGTVYSLYMTWCNDNQVSTLSKSLFFEELKLKNLFAKIGTVEGKTEHNVLLGHELSCEYKQSMEETA